MEGATNVLETLGTSVGFILTEFGKMATELLSTPLFLIGVSFFVVGGVIGLVRRITKG